MKNTVKLCQLLESMTATAIKEEKLKNFTRDFDPSGKIISLSDFTRISDSFHGDGKSKGKISVTVIKPGPTRDNFKFYPVNVLAEAVSLYEGVKMFADHATEMESFDRPEGSLDNWVAILENVRLDSDGGIIGDAKIIDPSFKQKVELLDSQKKLEDLGVSHNIIGEVAFEEIDDQIVGVVQKIVAVRSVDFVTEANAGGGSIMLESFNAWNCEKTLTDVILEKHLENDKKKKEEGDEAMDDATKARLDSLDSSLGKITEALQVDVDRRKKDEDTAKEDELKELRHKLKVQESATEINKIISESDLPDVSKEHLTERFKGSIEPKIVGIAVDKEIKYLESIGKLKESGVENLNGKDDEGDKDTPEKLEKSRKTLLESYTKTEMMKGASKEDAERKAMAMVGMAN